jgi:hypothetical protein
MSSLIKVLTDEIMGKLPAGHDGILRRGVQSNAGESDGYKNGQDGAGESILMKITEEHRVSLFGK